MHVVEHLKALCLYVMRPDDVHEPEVARTSSNALTPVLGQDVSRHVSTTSSIGSGGERSRDGVLHVPSIGYIPESSHPSPPQWVMEVLAHYDQPQSPYPKILV